MKVSFPLSLKISLWLLLNLLLLGSLFAGFFIMQGGFGWNSLVMGPAGVRLQSLGNIIAGEVAAAPGGTRVDVLARFSAAYGANLYLLNSEGKNVVGGSVTPPREVIGALELRPFPKEFSLMDGKRDLMREPGRGRPGSGPLSLHNGGDGERFRERREPPPMGAASRGRFLVHTADPPAYWIGLTVPFGAFGSPAGIPGPGGPPGRATLIVEVHSLWGVLRLLELQPWFLAAAAVFLLSALFWLPLVSGITRSLAQLTRATEQIAEGRFDTRVPSNRRDEIGRLGESVNRMAARLDTLAASQKRFLGDVAHELCSPLARLQMATSILEERAPVSAQSAVADVREEVQQMNALVNELLAFTKAGLKPRDVAPVDVDLADLVHTTLARENAIERVVTHLPPGLIGRADPELLTRALANLVRNALRYAGDAGPVVIIGSRDGKSLLVAVDDEGPGVPPEALERLGEPFYRPETARTRETGGVGLGLSIVRGSVEACGGSVHFFNRTPKGFRAELRIPAA